jgi:hypothetical protein
MGVPTKAWPEPPANSAPGIIPVDLSQGLPRYIILRQGSHRLGRPRAGVLFIKLLPYVGQDNVYNQIWPAFQTAIQAEDAAAAAAGGVYNVNPWPPNVAALYVTAVTQPACSSPIKTFICPSRRGPDAGGVCDYAGVYHGGINDDSLIDGLIARACRVRV